jgi:hypothetical protein
LQRLDWISPQLDDSHVADRTTDACPLRIETAMRQVAAKRSSHFRTLG